MAADNINDLMQVWAARHSNNPPFYSKEHLHEVIDSTALGDVPWESFTVYYNGSIEEGDVVEAALWKVQGWDVWLRNARMVLHNQLRNTDIGKDFDIAAQRVYDQNGKRQYKNIPSGNWHWRQSDKIAEDPETHGSTFCPIIMGSDKTTVSVATGHTEYYPLYLSNGLIHNNVRRSHCNGLTLVAFLATPKTDVEHKDSEEFRRFRRNLFHESLRMVLEPVRSYMLRPDIVRFPDAFFRRVIYGVGPYIADYPEQVLLACIVQGWCARCTARFDDLDGLGGRRSHILTQALFQSLGRKALWDDYGIVSDILPFTYTFPRADIHELIAPDLLHQLIKGTFKDHLVTWVTDYINLVHTTSEAAKIISDIDRRIAAAPPFPGLRRFPEGRGFKQWTGDDSKALMKVYLPAIVGHVPSQMVEALRYFLEFCYLVRRSVLDEDDLKAIDQSVENFHRTRIIFEDLGVRPEGFSLPRQHSLSHYPRGMLKGSLFAGRDSSLPPAPEDNEDDDGGAVDSRNIWGEVTLARKPITSIPFDAQGLADLYEIPMFPELISRFLYEQTHPNLDIPLVDVPLEECPPPIGKIRVYSSAVATFYAPSNISGIGGMFRERIRAVSSWRGGAPRYDCIYVVHDEELEGFRGLHAARVRLFFDITHDKRKYPCALVTWFHTLSDEPCPETGMWIVEPDLDNQGDSDLIMSVIHIDTILRAAHLIGRAGTDQVPRSLLPSDSLDAFHQFYINKYIDHHSHEIAF
ncbi:hypothetical protein C0992_005299 [Termitomyces sp. T32_za158]|nr:hypothetical protein C0992_005299 [Termitomyces sp. T32_za158]